jgi:hypothetical protein
MTEPKAGQALLERIAAIVDYPYSSRDQLIHDCALGKITMGDVADLRDRMRDAECKRDELLMLLGKMRICLNCGRTRDADEGRCKPGEGCPSPDACTWDHTPQEAIAKASHIAHCERLRAAAADARLAVMVEALERIAGASEGDADLDEWGAAEVARTAIRALKPTSLQKTQKSHSRY